jgi:CRISPR-associated protein Csb1
VGGEIRNPDRYGMPIGAFDSMVAAPTYKLTTEDRSTTVNQTLDVPGGSREVVVIDSVQSQSNRVEQRLAELFEDPGLPYPRIRIAFPGNVTLTNWQLSHRSADQSLRLTDYFEDKSRELNVRAGFASPYADLTYFLEHFPIDPILGTWHVHKGPTIKLPRLLSSTVIGYGPLYAPHAPTETDNLRSNRMQRGSQKTDPLIAGTAKVILKDGKIVDVDPDSKAKGKERLSAHGLGDVPGGVVASNVFALETIEQRVSLALSPLHKAHFPLDGAAKPDAKRDAAGRRMLIALALIAFRAALECDGNFRSGCFLAPVPGSLAIYAVDAMGEEKPYTLASLEDLVDEYRAATKDALDVGFRFEEVDATPDAAFLKAYEKNGKGFNHKEPETENGSVDAA